MYEIAMRMCLCVRASMCLCVYTYAFFSAVPTHNEKDFHGFAKKKTSVSFKSMWLSSRGKVLKQCLSSAPAQ